MPKKTKAATSEPAADRGEAGEERDGGGTGALNWDPDDERRRAGAPDFVDEVVADRTRANPDFPRLVDEAAKRRETAQLGAHELLLIDNLVEHLRRVETEDEPSKDGILLGLAVALGGKRGRERDLVFARRAYEMGKREAAVERDEWKDLAQRLRVQCSRITGALMDAGNVNVDPLPEGVDALLADRNALRDCTGIASTLDEAAGEIEKLCDALIKIAKSKDHARAVALATEALTLFEGR